MSMQLASHLPGFGRFAPAIGDALRAQGPRVARFRRRFRAWWEGYVEDEPTQAVKLEATTPADDADEWTAPRIKVAEMIWGDGFAFPGGVDHVMEMVKPMALNPKKSMLYLGAGLGGGPRAIAKTFGTWTVGLEISPTLAAAGMDYSKMAGLGKKALICPYDPDTVEMPAKKFDAICARHALGRAASRDRLLAALAKAIRPEGHLLISDFGAGSAADPTAADGTAPIVLDELAGRLAQLQFDVRVAEDTTAEFRKLVVKGWSDLAAAIEGKSLDPAEAAGLAQEIQTWQGRLAAFAADQVRVIRVHAIKKLG